MNFTEWYKQTARETETSIPAELVKEVLVTAIRVGLEELMSNKKNACLDILGIGKFYLNYSKCANHLAKDNKPLYRWQLKFKAKDCVREVINDERDIKTLKVGRCEMLYPDYDEIEKQRGYRVKYIVSLKYSRVRRGRPRIHPIPDKNAPKRKVGRPPKNQTLNMIKEENKYYGK